MAHITLGLWPAAGFIRPRHLGRPATNVSTAERNEPRDRVVARLVHQAASETVGEESCRRGAPVHGCAYWCRLLRVTERMVGQ